MMNFVGTTNYDFSQLPPNVLVNIMMRLKLPAFKNAVQTCKSWYRASCDPQIAQHILINGINDSKSIPYMRRPIHNIRFNKVNMNKFHFRKLLANFGQTITDVEIRMSTLAFTRVFEIFAYLPNVRTFNIYLVSNYFSAQNFYKCKALQKHRDTIVKNLSKIKCLTVHIRMRDLQPMKSFLSHCTNVETLKWNESIYLPYNQTNFICGYLLDPIENRFIANVTDLLIGCIHPYENQQFLTKLISVPLPNLRRLSIKDISNLLNDVTFREFCKTYHYLDEFTMMCCTGQQLHNICEYMTNLKVLQLTKCNAHNLVDIGQLHRLESLRLDLVNDNRDDTLIALLNLKLRNLTKLTLNYANDDVLTTICECYKNLEELDLTCVVTKNCAPIFRNLLNLKVLKLWFNMPAPCNSSRMDIMAECNITRLTKLEEIFVSCWLPGLTPGLVRQLPKLQRSCIEDTWDRTDEEFAEWAASSERRQEALAYILQPIVEVEVPEYELTDFDWSHYFV